MKTTILAAAAVAALALTACAKTVEAPSQAGLCYLMSPQKDGTVKFNSIAHDIKDLEHCALELELARRRRKRPTRQRQNKNLTRTSPWHRVQKFGAVAAATTEKTRM